MAKHVRRHIGDRKYACDICGKAFIEKQELKSHSKVHADSSESTAGTGQSTPKAVRSLSSSSSQDVQSQESSPCEVSSSLSVTPDSMVMITVIDESIESQQTVLATEVSPEISYHSSQFISPESLVSDQTQPQQQQRLPSISSFQYHVLSNADIEQQPQHEPVTFNCTLCSNCYQQAASLREHLITYHRVEAEKIH
jgi:hypothetical protein